MPVPIKKLTVSTTRRNAPKRGPTSSDAYNDTVAEVVQDLARTVDQWNNSIYPLLSSLPDGTNDLDAFTDGLDGQVIYTNQDATAGLADSTYWNSTDARPRSLHEQFEHVYAKFVTQKNELLTEIANASGALTDAQKERIGINIFTGGASSSTSLDGKSENNRLNIIQLAKDLYGPGFTLDNDGNANLANSLFAMVDALLELHGGNWDNDITLNHSSIGDFKADGTVPMTGALRLASGSAGIPSLTFDADTSEDTGFFRAGENEIGVTIGGVHKLTFGGTNELTAVDGILNLSGALVASSLISTATVLRQTSGYFGNTLNGVGAIAHIFDTLDAYVDGTSFLAKWRNNGTDQMSLDFDGGLVTGGSIQSGLDFIIESGNQLLTPSADTSIGLEDGLGIELETPGGTILMEDATGDLISDADFEAVEGRFTDVIATTGTFDELEGGNAGGGNYIRVTSGNTVIGKTDGGGDLNGLEVTDTHVSINIHDIGSGEGEFRVNSEDGNVFVVANDGTVTSLAHVNELVVKTSAGDYNVLVTDRIIVINKSSGAATAVNLPSSPATGRMITIKDGKGDAGTNNITVTPAAGNIDGSGTYVISTNYGSVRLVYNGTEWNVI